MAASTTYEQYGEALLLDVSILSALIKRNRSQHGRTLYFQRLSMTMRALQRYDLIELPNNMEALHQRIQAFVKEQSQGQWSRQRDAERRRELVGELEILRDSSLGVHLPQVLSRIEHAAQALFLEMSSGYFLPLCCVAVAALARIRAVLIQMGNQSLVSYSQMCSLLSLGKEDGSSWQDFVDKTKEFFVDVSHEEHQKDRQESDMERMQRTLGISASPSLFKRRSTVSSAPSSLSLSDGNTDKEETLTSPFQKENEAKEHSDDSKVQPQRQASLQFVANDYEDEVINTKKDDATNDVGEFVGFHAITKKRKSRKASSDEKLDINTALVQELKDKKAVSKDDSKRKSKKLKSKKDSQELLKRKQSSNIESEELTVETPSSTTKAPAQETIDATSDKRKKRKQESKEKKRTKKKAKKQDAIDEIFRT